MWYFFYNLMLPILFLIYSPFIALKQWRRGGVDRRYWQRLGLFSKAERAKLAEMDRPVWVHAVSVGETVAALNFIKAWLARDPQVKIVLSTSTTTGQALALKQAPEGIAVIYMPADFYGAIRRALRAVNPSQLIIFEVEIWPNLILQAQKMGVKLALVNCRMSDNSFKGYYKWRSVFRKLYGAFDVIGAQTHADAERIDAVCGETGKAVVCNTMKFDQAPVRGKTYSLDRLVCFSSPETQVLMAASTHPGEEALFLDLFKGIRERFPNLRLVLVPRHVERTPELTKLFAEKYSELKFQLFTEMTQEPCDVLLVNVTGELMKLLAVADVVYVGKGLCGNKGGHNIIEPAVYGKPVLHGPAMGNFKDVVAVFKEQGGTIEVNEETLESVVIDLFTDANRCQKLGQEALKTVQDSRGAIERTLNLLTK